MKSLAPFAVMIGILITIVTLITLLTKNNLKKRIIDRGPIDDNSLRFLEKLASSGSEVLKWGIIVLFGGIGLVVLEFIPYNTDESSLPYGVEAIFIATGLLIYYMIMRNEKKL